jgi:hypothetical protein
VSPTPIDLQQDSRFGSGENFIPSDQGKQEDFTNVDISDFDLNPTGRGQHSEVVESTKQFLMKSRKEMKAFNKQMQLGQLLRTRSGRVLTKPLSQGQRKYLQCIPKDTIGEYVENKK